MNEKHLLGHHIRQLRKARNMSLKQLAAAADCSESMLSKVENGKGNPSLNILHRVAKALGANMGSLFSPEAGGGVVQRKGARHLAQLTSGRGQGIILEYLTPDLPGHQLQAHIHIVEPGGSTKGDISHEGEEVGYVLEGELELIVEGVSHLLQEGDSFFFDSNLNHSFRNPGAVTARVLWVNTPPTF